MKLWDMSDMYKLINEYPHQFERGFRIAEQISLPKTDINNIVITAVGHDAAVAQIVCDLFRSMSPVPISINQDLTYSKPTDHQTLVINLAVTYYPEEMVALAKKYYDDKAQIVTITTGGEPEVFARDRKTPLIFLDNGLPEWKFRMGSGLIIATLTHILINYGILPQSAKTQVLQAATGLEEMYLTKLGDKISKSILGNSVALLYAPNNYLGLSYLIKHLTNTLLQLPCFVGLLSDYKYSENHGFARKNWNKFFALVIQGADKDKHLATSIQKQLSSRKIDSLIWELDGQNALEKSFAGIMLFYWAIYWSLKSHE